MASVAKVSGTSAPGVTGNPAGAFTLSPASEAEGCEGATRSMSTADSPAAFESLSATRTGALTASPDTDPAGPVYRTRPSVARKLARSDALPSSVTARAVAPATTVTPSPDCACAISPSPEASVSESGKVSERRKTPVPWSAAAGNCRSDAVWAVTHSRAGSDAMTGTTDTLRLAP